MARAVELLPVRKSVAAMMGDYLKKNPKFKDAWDLLNASDTTAEPPFSGYDLVRDAASQAFSAILDGATCRGPCRPGREGQQDPQGVLALT